MLYVATQEVLGSNELALVYVCVQVN